MLDAVEVGGHGRRPPRARATCCPAGARASTSAARRCPTWTPDPRSGGDWLLIGCERSLQFHRHFYGDEPERVDLCPRNRAAGRAGKVLTKCCLIERGLEVDGDTAVVPWGANLDEVREGLRKLLAVSSHLADSAIYGHLWTTPELHALFDDRGRTSGLADHPRRAGAGPGRRRAGARRGRRR